MIKGKPKFAGLEGDALTLARLDDLDRRLYEFELSQGKAWTWNASAQGMELEKKLDALQESLADLSAIVSGLDDTVLDEKRLAAAETRLADALATIAELERRSNQLFNLTEALANVAGYSKWDGNFDTWPDWFEHVTGCRPD